jgi:hypothetical protein
LIVCNQISGTLWLLVFSSVIWFFPSSCGFVCLRLLCAEFLIKSSVVVAWWSYIVLVSVYCGRFLLLHLFWMIVLLGRVLFSFSAWNTSLHVLVAFNVYIEKSAVILRGLFLYVICSFLSYSLQYSFSGLCACCFNDNMLWKVLFWSSLSGVLEASTWMGKTF